MYEVLVPLRVYFLWSQAITEDDDDDDSLLAMIARVRRILLWKIFLSSADIKQTEL